MLRASVQVYLKHLIFNSEDGEGENILNLMTDQRVVRENNNLEGLLGTEEATQGGPNHKTLVARRKEDLKRKISKEMSNIMLYKTQGKEEVIYLTQKGFNEKEVKKTNWVNKFKSVWTDY